MSSASSASTSNDVQTSDASDSHEGGKKFKKTNNNKSNSRKSSRNRRAIDIFDMDALVADDDGADESLKLSTDTTDFVKSIHTFSYFSSSSTSNNMHDIISSPLNNFPHNLPNSSPFSIVLSSTNDNYIDVNDNVAVASPDDDVDDNQQHKIISPSNSIDDGAVDDNNNTDDDYGISHTNSDKFLTSTNRSFDGDIIFVNDVNLVVAEVPDVTNMNVDEFVTNNNKIMVNGDSYNNKNKINLRDDEGYDAGSGSSSIDVLAYNGDGKGGYRANNDDQGSISSNGNGDVILNEKNKNDINRPIKYSNFIPTQTYTNEESFNEKLNRKNLFENNHKNVVPNKDDNVVNTDTVAKNEILNDFPLLSQPDFINYGQDNVDIVKLDSDSTNSNEEKTKTVYNQIDTDDDIEIHQLSDNNIEITNSQERSDVLKKMPKYQTNNIEIKSSDKETEQPSLILHPPLPLPPSSSSSSSTTNNEPQRLLLNITIGTDTGIGTQRQQIYVLQVAVPGGPNFHPSTPTYEAVHDSQNSLNCPPVPPPAPPCPCSCFDNNNFAQNNDDDGEYRNEMRNFSNSIESTTKINNRYDNNSNNTVATANDVNGDGLVNVDDDKNEENDGDFMSTTTEWMIDKSGAMIEVNEKLCPDATPILILEGERTKKLIYEVFVCFILHYWI